MTTNKPEVFEVYRTRQGTLENVVLLADYEALQAEYEKLCRDAELKHAALEREVEPVAWMTHHDEPMFFETAREASAYCDHDENPIPLYAAPQPAGAALPPEITREMLGMIIDEVFGGGIEDASVIEDIYRVIARSAAPQFAEQQPKCSTCRDVGIVGHSNICPECVETWAAPENQPSRAAAEQQPAPDVAELQAELERERKRRFDGNEQASREHREDVAELVEALEWLRGAINATPENDKVQAGTWISTKHPRIKQIDAILAARRKQEPSHDNQ